ncbi:MAG: hypothetical protein MZU91_13325 [Desulfosudis oleivorans]|nr:hypothetical protein [Desulfosudis oleivorans]
MNDQFVGKSGTIEVSKISVFTVTCNHPGAQRFAYPCRILQVLHIMPTPTSSGPICLWNRDSDGLDDLFVSDHYATYKSYSQAGVVYGISNYPMFGIGRFDATGADPPNSKTLYAEHRSYGFKGSAWNKWNLFGTTMKWDFIVGNYKATVRYTNPTQTVDGAILEVLDDYWGILRVDTDSVRLTPDYAKDTLYVDFNVLFTMNLPVEGDLDVKFTASAAHITYTQLIEEVGKGKEPVQVRW